MTTFLRLLADRDKANSLLSSCKALRMGETDTRTFLVEPEAFQAVPGVPFAYWVTNEIRGLFSTMNPLESKGRSAKQGLATSNDFRFVRGWWEQATDYQTRWTYFSKGGAYSPFYSDIHLVVNWGNDGAEIKAEVDQRYSHIKGYQTFWVVKNPECYLRPGLTWPLRTHRFGPRVLPAGCIFGHKGPILLEIEDQEEHLLATLAIWTSKAYETILSTQLNAADASARSFEIGVLQRTVLPNLNGGSTTRLAALGRRAWSLKRLLDTISETSHAFVLPGSLRQRLGDYNPPAIEAELSRIQSEIDSIAFELYGFSEADRQTALGQSELEQRISDEAGDDEEEDTDIQAPPIDALLSWAVGVAFGRFDWRLATDERKVPTEPGPFDTLPVKSPGMLPDGAEPFHAYTGILVDDQGHPHDLARLVEEVLTRVDVNLPDDVRRWLQRDFFAFHLLRYSKSRRKAPIYWPLSTTSGIYTLWFYYPSLTSQTLYTAINDFVEPKLKQIGANVVTLRSKGTARTRDDEKQFETLQAFELELIELRDTLLKLAPTYKPRHDDGVQICAAPLWQLFRYKPWQKVLKDTWTKLDKGDYDWSHLAMNYWPERVREKCKTDKSLAIAHGLEDLFVELEAAPKKTRSKKKTGGEE